MDKSEMWCIPVLILLWTAIMYAAYWLYRRKNWEGPTLMDVLVCLYGIPAAAIAAALVSVWAFVR